MNEDDTSVNTSIEKSSPWRYKRYYVYAFATVFTLVIPWITVDGNHFFLFSFDKLKLHLAFIEFDMQELYLMPFLLMSLFLFIFGITVMGGRVFCGWLCPQTVFRVIYRDLIETKIFKLRKRINNKQIEPDMSLMKNKIKKAVILLLSALLALVAAADFLFFFVPPEDFFVYLADYQNHFVLLAFWIGTALFLIYDIVFLQENFCIYVCPYSRVQSVLYDDHTVKALYDVKRGGQIYDDDKKLYMTKKEIQAAEPDAECIACDKCVTVCPTHIDIRQGTQLECINCLECVDACTSVMEKLGKPTLVTWSSEYEVIDKKGKTKLFRGKVIGYMVILILIMGALTVLGSKKEHMLLNVNKETRLYSVKQNFGGQLQVDNAYEFLVQNTQKEPMKFYFEVIAPKDLQGKIYIFKPQKEFTVVPGKRKKKVVVLRTNDMLAKDKQDTIIPIVIRAYAVDDPENIVVYRDSTFTFPSIDIINKKFSY